MVSLRSRAATPIPTDPKTSRTGPPGQDDVKADSLEVLDSVHKRATNWHLQSRAKLSRCSARALDGYRKTQGPDGVMTLDLTLDLAALLDQSGRGAEAEPLSVWRLRSSARRLGPADPEHPVSWPSWA